jgi:hypothetical protein
MHAWRKCLYSLIYNIHLRQHVEDYCLILLSYMKDTTDKDLNKTPSLSLPDHTLLVNMYDTSLHTNIPHDEGIETCKEVWSNRVRQGSSTESLIHFLEHVISCHTTCKLVARPWERKWHFLICQQLYGKT